MDFPDNYQNLKKLGDKKQYDKTSNNNIKKLDQKIIKVQNLSIHLFNIFHTTYVTHARSIITIIKV